MGAVTEDSLVWQEGLDEWRPLRTFPDLAATVREAAGGGRSSVLPAPGSGNPPRSPSAWPMAPSAGQRAAAPQRMAPVANPPLARSNVVAITSRLATAERLEEPPQVGFGVGAPLSAAVAAPATETRTVPAAVASAMLAPAVTDPFASAPAAPSAATAVPSVAPPYRPQKGPPLWFLLLLLAIGGAFGITAALALFVWRAQAPAPAVVQAPVPSLPSAASAGVSSTAEPSPVNIDTVPVVIAVNGGSSRPAGGSPTAPKASAAPSATGPGRTLDLHGIGAGPTIAPVDDQGNDGAKAAGSCLSEGQVQQTIQLHRVAIQRSCWERSSNGKLAVNVSVLLTIAADGSPQGVTASGDDPSVAKCIENDVKGWRFPAMGCSQRTSIPFHFVRQ